jgi:hypothetical protein
VPAEEGKKEGLVEVAVLPEPDTDTEPSLEPDVVQAAAEAKGPHT